MSVRVGHGMWFSSRGYFSRWNPFILFMMICCCFCWLWLPVTTSYVGGSLAGVMCSIAYSCVHFVTSANPHTHLTDGLDLRQSSLISGPIRGSTPLGYPYQPVPSDLKEHWRVLDEFKNVPFSQWTLQAIVSWMEAGIGKTRGEILLELLTHLSQPGKVV